MPIFVAAGVSLAVVTVFSTILIQPVTRAQALSTHVMANIPFAFQVGPYHLRPGVYRFEMQARGFLAIKGEVGSTVVLVMSPWSNRRSLNSALVFEQRDDRHILREVRTGGAKGFFWSGETKAAPRSRRGLTESSLNSVPREESKVEIALVAPHR
ncbi:MAG TPA: hypothetical protein VGU25_10815 [Acidobacteriaceae bacterium]|nr:hypothetical protein [Acidobacteriaceae bacterium]